MAYESLIDNTEIIQGDSSDIYLFTLDGTMLADEFTSKFTVRENWDTPVVITRVLSKNDGSEGYVAGSHFVFQLTPAETATLAVGTKYIVSIQVTNESLTYNAEIAQFKLKILPQGV